MVVNRIERGWRRGGTPQTWRLMILVLVFGMFGMGDCEQDLDGDGYSPEQGDCDDFNATIYPGADETCDDVDNDCDGEIDEGFDLDGDGYSVCSTGSTPADCDDQDPLVYPGADERCNGLDDNCDGVRDDGIATTTALLDGDGDGFGALTDVCAIPEDLVTTCGGDCNDQDPNVYPGADDTTGDGLDQDCGGLDGPQPHVGLSGSSADSIQDALDAAEPGSIVWVGPGTYHESAIRFNGKALTLAGACGAETTVVDADGAATVFIFDHGETTDTVLTGFTITGGVAGSEFNGIGGGLLAMDAGPTLSALIITGNQARAGGGAGFLGSSATIRDCLFTQNSATTEAGDGRGGGVFADESNLSLTYCRIEGNRADEFGGGLAQSLGTLELRDVTIATNTLSGDVVEGAGMKLVLVDDAYLDGCNLIDNTAGETGQGGGAVFETSTTTLVSTHLASNSALLGGAIFAEGGTLTLVDTTLEDNQVGWSDGWGNGVDGEGGGMFLDSISATVTHSSLLSNQASGPTAKGGAIRTRNASLVMDNVILGHNAVHGFNAGYGGGLFLEDTTATLEHIYLEDNDVGGVWYGEGGAFNAQGSDVTITASILVDNASYCEWAEGGAGYFTDSYLAMRNCVVAFNHATYNVGGLALNGGTSPSSIVNTIFYLNDYYNLDVVSGYEPEVHYSCLYKGNTTQQANHNLESLDETNTEDDPQFLNAPYSSGRDFHLALGSPVIDQGDPAFPDEDGTPADMGCFGSVEGAAWDLDSDGRPNYFWPGTLEDAPSGFDPADFDADDMDPGI